MDVTLRPAVAADDDFLRDVYGSTREAELAITGWTDAEKHAFVQMQHEAQDRHYRQYLTDTSYEVILVDGQPAGRLYVARWTSEIRIVDIALLPPFRGRGIGTGLLEAILAEAAAGSKKVSIHVERFNPALRLYQRLGFSMVADQGVYLLMERPAPAAAQVNTAS